MVARSSTAFTTTGKAAVDVGLVGLTVIRGTGMMLIPGPDSLGRSDAEVCAAGVVDAFEVGAGVFEGLADVSSVVGTEITEGDSEVLPAVAEGIVELEDPAVFGVGLAAAKELDELDLVSVVVGPDENVGFAPLGMIIVGRLNGPVEGLVADDGFPV